MTEQKNIKPMSWLKIILILIAAALATGLLFGALGTIFNLSASVTKLGIPVVVGALAAFLIVRRQPVIAQQYKP